jgi:anti-anti-sigma factor
LSLLRHLRALEGYVFDVRTDTPADGLVVVRAAGEVDMTVSTQFEQALLDAATGHPGGRVVVDFEELRFLDSSGVHALVKGYHAATGTGGSLTVRNATGVVARVLTITGVAEALGMSGTGDPDEIARGA